MASLALPKHLLCFFISHCAGDFRLDTKLNTAQLLPDGQHYFTKEFPTRKKRETDLKFTLLGHEHVFVASLIRN
jgi:hypothetical protein